MSAFVEALSNDRLSLQACSVCGHSQVPDRLVCSVCGSRALTRRDASGSGTVYAMTAVYRAPNLAFRNLVPYLLVLIDLAEGPRIMGHGEPGLTIGSRVKAATFHVDGEPLLSFRRDVDD